jgi:epoxyqueuosine reductase
VTAALGGVAGDDVGTQADRVLTDRVLEALTGVGLVAGVARAERFEGTRRDLETRKAAGLHGGMAFTYRNPARSTDPGRALDGAQSLVVGALGYLRDRPASPAAVAPGRVARYAWSDAYAELTDRLGAGAAVLRAGGFRTVVLADQNALVDREAARRAGLGWYGRNANLLLPGRGSWYVLGTIVTDAPLLASSPSGGGCGSCTRCVPACPTGAIVASGVVDARRCLAWLLQATGVFPVAFREALGDRIYGCDDCQEACPPNRAASTGPAAEGDRATVDVIDLLDDDDRCVLERAGRWYVAQRNARFLRRNALVVLGNTADPRDERAVAAVSQALRHADPLVRAHAVWAAARLGRPDLADRLDATEADPMVRRELLHRHEVASRR